MSILQCSIGSGWQNGIISAVRLTACTPAMIAVSNTGPLALRWPLARNARATAAGSARRASASAIRCVTCLALTLTMVGRRAASRWLSPVFLRRVGMSAALGSATHVIHFDTGGPVHINVSTQLAVAVRACQPAFADGLQQFLIAGTRAQWRAQIEALGREQAGVEHAVGGQACPRAIAAEGLRDRGDQSDLALAVHVCMALRDLADKIALHRPQRPAAID